MVPGVAFSTGSVPPASCRNAAIARGPFDHGGNQRAAGDELDQAGVEALALVLGVVLLGDLERCHPVLEADQLQALALDPADTSPTSPRATPSGLISTRVRSMSDTNISPFVGTLGTLGESVNCTPRGAGVAAGTGCRGSCDHDRRCDPVGSLNISMPADSRSQSTGFRSRRSAISPASGGGRTIDLLAGQHTGGSPAAVLGPEVQQRPPGDGEDDAHHAEGAVDEPARASPPPAAR